MAQAEPLKKIIDKLGNLKSANRFCLIVCPDQIRQLRIIKKLRASLPQGAETKKFDGASANEESLRKLFFSLQNSSLFASETHVLINGVDQMSAALAKTLVTYIKEAAPSTVIIASATKLATNLALYKFFDQAEALFELPELTGADLEKWIARELTQAGIVKFPATAPPAIRQASGESADRAFELTSKIALYVDGDTLNTSDLLKLIPPEGRVDEFEFIGQIASCSRARLELMVTQLLAQGVSPFPLLGLLAKNYNSYHALNYLMKGRISAEQIARQLGSPPWLIKKISPIAQRYTLPHLRNCIAGIARADSLLKNRSLGNEAIMSELLETLAL